MKRWLVGLALALPACTAQRAGPPASAPAPAPEAAPAARPQEAEESFGAAEQDRSAPTRDAPPLPGAPPGAPTARAAPLSPPPPGTPLAEALGALEEAESALQSLSAGGCTDACRALDSMVRAAGRICALEPPPGRGRCHDARDRVARARARVSDSCRCPAP